MNKEMVFGAWFFILALLFSLVSDVVILEEPESAVTQDTEYQPVTAGSYAPHGPITISGNAEFSGQGWPGNGTTESPYVIEGLNITADAVCISITGTTAYFEIRASLISSESQSYYHGIVLDHVSHGTVRDCIIDLHSTGFYLSDSSNCIAANNTVIDNHHGFSLSSSSSCTLVNNTAIGNDYGFFVYVSHSCMVVNNTAISNDQGFYLHGSDSCIMANNSAACNSLKGIVLYSSTNCTLANNTVASSQYAFDLDDSDSCTLMHNKATSSLHVGFLLRSSSNCTLTNNTLVDNGLVILEGELSDWLHDISGNWVNGKPLGYFRSVHDLSIDGSHYGQVVLAACSDVTVRDGTFSYSSAGIQLGYCVDCEATNNTATSNYIGFYMRESESCTLANNIAASSYIGFSLDYSNNCVATNNTATNNTLGFHLYRSNNCMLGKNAATNNSYGLSLDSSQSCTLMRNIAASNSGDGFRLYGSGNCKLMHNTAFGNSRYGIYMDGNSDYNTLYLNRLGSNSMSNAEDGGDSNLWDDGVSSGNFWMDYSGTGIYLIHGSAGSEDHYPTVWHVEIPTLDSPRDIGYFEGRRGFSITWSPYDFHPASYVIYLDGTPVRLGTWNSSSEVIAISVDGLALGTYNYTLVVTNTGGNSAIDVVIVTVVDRNTSPDMMTIITIVLSILGGIIIIIGILVLKKR